MKRTCTCFFALFFLLLTVTACHKGENKQPVVLFDQAHGQRFLADQEGTLALSGLAAIFKEGGFDVKTSDKKITSESLSTAKALVISGPFLPFAPAEVDRIIDFVEKGGRLSVMLHIASPVDPLLRRLDVAVSNGVIYEQDNVIDDQPLDFNVVDLVPHPLTRDLKDFKIYGAWALLSTGKAREVARTGPHAWVDLNRDKHLNVGERDAAQAFGVVVAGSLGKGRFVVFGDDAIFQNKFLIDNNKIMARNLVKWLAGD